MATVLEFRDYLSIAMGSYREICGLKMSSGQ